MASPSLPCGASFSPGDAELITVYLKRKISGSPLPAATAHYIHDADIYAAQPAELVAGLLAASAKNDGGSEGWYFFTSVRAKSSRDTRRCRTVVGGVGTWHSEKGRLDVLDGDEVVGYRQFFTFEPRNGWLMLEFSVLDREDDGHRGEAIPVLCKIYQTRRQSASKSGSKRKGERSGEDCSARVRRCLQFGSPPAAPNQLAMVAATSGYEEDGFLVPVEPQKEHGADDPKEPDKQQEPWVTTTTGTFLAPFEEEEEKEPHKQPFFVPFEQEEEESQYSGFAGASLIPTFPMTTYGTTLLHPGQDLATSEIPQGTYASTLLGNTAGLSCYDGNGMTTSLPSIWSFPTSTMSSSNNTLMYPRHDASSMGIATSVPGCYDASSMYWSEAYAPTAPMSNRAEWANHGSNTNPLSYLCI